MPKSITRLPPEPKVGSRVPLAERRRTTQKELAGPPPPAATTLPLGCTSTACAASMPPKLTVFFPPLPKVVSRSPGCAMPRTLPARGRGRSARASTRRTPRLEGDVGDDAHLVGAPPADQQRGGDGRGQRDGAPTHSASWKPST